jgi:predicted ATPase/class 3 adenylate cyclase
MVTPLVPTTSVSGRSEGAAGLSTFLITDIEASTRLWEEHSDAMGAALAVHDRLLRAAIESNSGAVVKTMGDGMLAVFDDPLAAVAAALEAQRALGAVDWGATGPLRVRMAIHSGAAEARDGDFFGPALNRDARILAIGHGGQILLSAVASVLTRERLPANIELLDLGPQRLRDLDRPEQVFQVAVADLQRAFPPLRSLSARRSNLPVALTSFIGREREIAAVDALAKRARLVTLVGTGGTGKTRLMLEVADRTAGRFSEGAWLVELAALADPEEIAPEIARTLGVPEVPGRSVIDSITEFLGPKELLLLLDNAEHLVEGVARIAGRLLAGAPGLRIVTTSREALAVPGEFVFPVPSLGCPVIGQRGGPSRPSARAEVDAAMATDAVRLFADRASSIVSSFELTSANVESVAEICRRVDGIPLAIELAAARVSAMSPEEIAARIGDRFRLLSGGRRTAVPRQQTLQTLIDWSWGLLTDDDRRLLRRLSVFSSGWSAVSAAWIAGEPDGSATPGETTQPGDTAWLERAPSPGAGDDGAEAAMVDELARLVDRSLVVAERAASTRYRMLETIRQYARDRLVEANEAEAIAGRHVRWFAALAEAAAPGLRGPAMVDWLDRIDVEADNVRAALEWSLEASSEQGLQMCIAMFEYWRNRPFAPGGTALVDESIEVARRLAAGPPPPSTDQLALAGRALGGAAFLWAVRGDAAKARLWAQDAVELARSSDDPDALVTAILGRVMVGVFSGEREDPRPLMRDALELARARGDWFSVGAIAGMGAAGISKLDPTEGAEWMAIAVEASSRTGNPLQLAMTAVGHGRMLGATGRIDEARAQFEVASQRFREIGDARLALVSRSDLGHALRGAGRLEDAEAIYRECLPAWVGLGNRGAVASILESLAFVAIARNDAVRAARLLAAAEALRELASAPMTFDEADEHGDWVEGLRAAADPGTIANEWAAGRAMSMADAIAFATA